MSTTFLEGSGTRTWGGHPATHCSDEMLGRYRTILEEKRAKVEELASLLLEKEVVDRDEFVKLIDGDGQKQVLAG